VHRLSTLLGAASTGEVRSFGAIHDCLRLYHRGLTTAVPGQPDSIVHLLPVDYAADVVFRLFEEQFQAGRTVHIVANRQRGLTLQEFLHLTHQAILAADPHWNRRGVEVPPIVDLETFNLLCDTAGLIGDRTVHRIMRILSYFAPQQAYPKDFVSSLPAAIGQPPPLADYLPNVIRFCIASDWGRRIAGAGVAASGCMS
jgi:hypothetical protein